MRSRRWDPAKRRRRVGHREWWRNPQGVQAGPHRAVAAPYGGNKIGSGRSYITHLTLRLWRERDRIKRAVLRGSITPEEARARIGQMPYVRD